MSAQRTGGSISGQVTDITGAAVPGATITLIRPSTGARQTGKVNSAGEYTFENVPNGTYQIEVSAAGFSKNITNDVKVDVATNARADVHLAAGNVSEVVTVTADQVQVQTDSGSLGSVIDGTQVEELPLNGRSFVELTQLTTGVSAANNFDSKNKGLQGGVDFSVNGNPTTNNLFLVDSVPDNDVGSNRTILIYPSIEAIAEFKMLTNSYGPEYGQASGAIISIVTKGGTNTFHGSAFYDGRNDALASYTYFARQNANPLLPEGGKDKLRRNDFGYSIGGPIKRDKLFFFFNEEFNREIRGYTQSSCVASAAERAGDFTTTTCGAAQPNIPVQYQKAGNKFAFNQVDPTGALLPQYYTLPNRATPINGNNWSQSLPTFLKDRQENVRIDYAVTKHNTIMGRYTQEAWSNPSYNGNQYWGDTIFPVINSNWSQPSKSMIGRITTTISDSLVNEAAFTYSNNRINLTTGGTDPGLLNQMSAAINPLYSPSLKTASASTPTVWSGLGQYGNYNTIWSIAPWNNQFDVYRAHDDISKVLGTHLLKAGVLLSYDDKNEDAGPSSSERPTFQTFDYAVDTSKAGGGFATGNPLANVLVPNNPFFLSENSTNIRAQLRWRDYEFYGGDTWKVSPRLTLTYGLRYSLLPPTFQPNNQIASFQARLYDPSKPASDACNGLETAPGTTPCANANKQFGTNFSEAAQGPNKYLVNVNYHLFSPRVGIAYDVHGDGKMALRAGFGEFYQRERVSRYTLVGNAPFVLAASNVSRALSGATPGKLSGTASPQGGFDEANTLPKSFQYNVSVQQELIKNTNVQISYVGNRAQHLTSSYDLNTIDPTNWAAATFAQGQAQNAYRPFSNFGSLTYWSHNGDSNYNSLQVALKSQLSSSFLLGIAYTWSHGLADIVNDDSNGGLGTQSFTYYKNPSLDKGNTATNRPNIFVANVVYKLPLLKGHSLLTQESLGGWELTTITSADSGNSLSVYQNSVNDSFGGPVGSLFFTGLTGNQRPLMTPGQACSGSGQNTGGQQVINPNAFTLIGYHLGTLDPGMVRRGVCQGPKYVNTDFSVDKNWSLGERFVLQFRLDAFDLFNHANFRGDQTNLTNPITSVTCGTGPCSATNNVVTAQTRNATFGQATGLVGNAERQLQYGLHLQF